MLHLFFFTSSRKSDKLSCVTVLAKTVSKAYALASLNFAKNNYKGKPVILAI